MFHLGAEGIVPAATNILHLVKISCDSANLRGGRKECCLKGGQHMSRAPCAGERSGAGRSALPATTFLSVNKAISYLNRFFALYNPYRLKEHC